MLEELYRRFNRDIFSPEKYSRILAAIAADMGDTCLRMSETPVFLPRALVNEMVAGSEEIIRQCLAPELRARLAQDMPPEFNMPSAPEKPAFYIIDFAVTAEGPRLVELQAFASNLVFIPRVAQIYKNIYGLEKYPHLLSDISCVEKAILGGHAPENVILMEINPWQQKSRRDFVATQKLLGIPVVDVLDIIRDGDRLFYPDREGKQVRIRRIYNRVVPEEFQSLNLGRKAAFRFSDPLDVEWAGDPGWFLRISKHVTPYLDHPLVPETKFLDAFDVYPSDLGNYVLKPVFSNAGAGVKLNITAADLDAVPADERHRHILMRKIKFLPFIPDLNGNILNSEVRVMFVQTNKLEPFVLSARIMLGMDTNENLWAEDSWCGLAPVLIVDK